MKRFWLAGIVSLSACAFSGMASAQQMGHEPFMARLDQLNLSDAQWLSVHKIMVANHSQGRSMRRAEHDLWRSLQKLNPDASDYASQVQAAESQAAQLAEQRVQEIATVKQQVYAVLSDTQKTQLAALPQPDRDGPNSPSGD